LLSETIEELKPSARSCGRMYSTGRWTPNVRSGCASTAKWILLSTHVGQRELRGPGALLCDSTVKMQTRKMVSNTKEVMVRKRFETVISLGS
jgi:hypothetical protein